MSIGEFVSDLKKLDVQLSVNGQRLRVNAPKGVLTESLRAQLAERKQELLEFLRSSQLQDPFVAPPIGRRAVEGPTPLSFAQERLWFLEQLEPGNSVYNICRAFRLTGQLNVAALEASFTELIRRHEILRSQISIIGGRATQIAAAAAEFKLHFTDLRSLTVTMLGDEIRRQIKAEVEQQFDFSAGLFLRGALLRTNNDQHVLILTMHHIVADAWSMGILAGELWTLYDAYAHGRSTSLREPPVQYADYAVWQRGWMQGEVLESELSYWRKQLENLSVLNLLTDHPRPAKQSYRGARQLVSLPQSLTTAINELSRREGVTQFMTLLAAFQALLYRYTGQEDIVIGSPIVNRNRTEIDGAIGFFVNTLVLRSDLSGIPSFREFLLRVREVCLGAYAHQDLPFEKLVEELRPERDLSRNPLFQVMFVLQNTPRPLPEPAGLSIERVDVLPATSLFDLSLYLRERDGKLIGFVEYSIDLFESSTIERMIGHLETLLRGIVADPGRPVSTLPLLTEAERQQILVEWNDTAADYPKDKCIHHLFEAQVERTPEAVAVQFEGKQLTYRELNTRANHLAHYLQALGVGPEKLVGICVERSIEMVIGLLGILKAGGAYVPLDPAYPRERLEFMLKDAQVSVLLTQKSLIEDRGWKIEDSGHRFLRPSSGQASVLGPQMKIVCLDKDLDKIAVQSERNPEKGVTAQNLAYVIYTSGSTGQPKGVAIEHRNTVAFLYWARTVFTPVELSGVLASTSICFDLSIFELFVPLSWGGKIILAENALHLHSIAEKNGVTLVNTVPSAMAELLAMGDLPASIQTVNLAGEALRSDLVEQIYCWRNVNKVYDLYGPSETTTYMTFTLRASNQPATIGRPIANSRIYILDGSFEPVPVGVTGEIFIGGVGVARGYLNRSELTGEMFIADPFREGEGGRLYRTGDRGRYLPDGNIEFIGRTDNQVKIHGYRIELGEIEAILIEHPTVKDCVVVARECEAQSGKNLVGYVVPRELSVLSVTELRSYLKEKLPEYMIPSSFVVLEALPLTPNGKVDRNTLPPPDGTRPPLTEEFVPPRTEIEELIAQTWREVLKIENVGISDNFFELGGHSLLAIQIVARLQEVINKDVPLRVLFDAPTVAALAQELETIIRNGHAPELPPIVPVPRDEPLPLSMNQEHLWRMDQVMPGTFFFNVPYVYRLSGELNSDALEKALREIIRRHEALRTVFQEIDGRPAQIVKDGSDFQLQTVDFRGPPPDADDASRAAAENVVEERWTPFDLVTGPLCRVKLLRLTDTDALLVTIMHHIISDHWSMQIFRRELLEFYGMFVKGQRSRLPSPKIQIADYATWERRVLANGFFEREIANQQLENGSPATENEERGIESDQEDFLEDYVRQVVIIDGELFRQIGNHAKESHCTPCIVVICAFCVSLYRMLKQSKIRIGTLTANRGNHITENVIGHFANTSVLSVTLSAQDTYAQVLTKVRAASLDAYANQKIPFEYLAQKFRMARCSIVPSLFSVLFNYQRHDFAATTVAGLCFSPLVVTCANEDTEKLPSSFDFILDVKETGTLFEAIIRTNRRFATQRNVTGADVEKHFRTALQALIFEPWQRLS